jgi:addiction module HigA family antidote
MGQIRNPHPGEILKEEFLKEVGVSQNQLAQAIGVPGNCVHAIVKGTRDISADTDLRLCKFFGLTDGYFLRLQNAYDLLEARRKIAREVTRIKRYKSDRRHNLGRTLCELKRNPVIASARCVRAGFSHHHMSRSRF